MSREYRISWNEAQTKRLKSAVRKYNNAIRRAAKSDPVAAQFLPSEVKYREVKESILTARQLNAKVNSLLRATKPGAMKFVRQGDAFVTKYERGEYSILRSVRERKKSMELRRRAEEFAKIPYRTKEEAALMPDKRPIGAMQPSQIRRFIDTQSRHLYEPAFVTGRRWMDNYIKSVHSEFGSFGMFEPLVAKLEGLIGSVEPAMVSEVSKLVPTIDFTYNMMDKQYKLEKIVRAWEEVAANERFARRP